MDDFWIRTEVESQGPLPFMPRKRPRLQSNEEEAGPHSHRALSSDHLQGVEGWCPRVESGGALALPCADPGEEPSTEETEPPEEEAGTAEKIKEPRSQLKKLEGRALSKGGKGQG